MIKAPLRVDTDLTPDEISKAMHGKWMGEKPTRFSGIALDTRAVQKGDLFFALSATRDGHDFIKDAFANGASVCVIHKEPNVKGNFIMVKETIEGLADLAKYVRRKWGKSVVGISGSNGKTTTKELTAAVLRGGKKVLKTPGTWNNNLGVPLTLFLLRPDHEVAVLELGINDFGEMTQLCKIAEPNLAILTNIGPVHLEKLGSMDGVAKAKGELFHALPKDGIAIINQDDPKISLLAEDLSCKKVFITLKSGGDLHASVTRDHGPDGLTLQVTYGKETVELRTPLVGVHNVYNLLCALGVAYALKIPKEKLQQGLNQFERPEMRLEAIKVSRNICIINDCYNANPASTMVALEVVRNMAPGRAIAVLGDMLELGDFSARAHRDIGIRVASHKYSYLFAMGRFAGDLRQGAIQGGMKEKQIKVFKTHNEVVDALTEVVEPNDMILVKGSRGMKLENVSEPLALKLKGGVN